MVDRIKQIMDEKALTPSQFADGMDVPRAVLSHVLSGRNKPSLDVVLKIAETHTDVSLEWLLLGKGEMLMELAADPPQNQVPLQTATPIANLPEPEAVQPKPIEKIQNNAAPPHAGMQHATGSRIMKQVLFFYTDGTFEVFNPGS